MAALAAASGRLRHRSGALPKLILGVGVGAAVVATCFCGSSRGAGGVVTAGVASAAATTFLGPAPAAGAAESATRRREVSEVGPDGDIGARSSVARRGVAVALAVGLEGTGLSPLPASAMNYRPVKAEQLVQIKDGYDDLLYLLGNWNKATRECDEDISRKVQPLQSGVKSPDLCTAKPDNVRKYLGLRSVNEKLFNTKQLWIDIQAAGDYLTDDQEEDFQQTAEEFERFKQQAGDWAYTSSWGEANPGGGRDKVEDYLLRSKADTVKAVEKLGELVKILKLV